MIALLTDFGNSEYAGIVRGVLHSFNPDAQVVDLFNGVEPFNIREAAWILRCSFSYFPKGTVFLVVVDPGVGSARAAIAIKAGHYFFVGPDNGVLLPAARKAGIKRCISLKRRGSRSFEARDVFAPAAAIIEKKQTLKGVGAQFKPEAELSFKLQMGNDYAEGEVVRTDSFGNVVTNIPSSINADRARVILNDFNEVLGIFDCYSDAPPRKLSLIRSSCSSLEIAIPNGRASDILHANEGMRVSLRWGAKRKFNK